MTKSFLSLAGAFSCFFVMWLTYDTHDKAINDPRNYELPAELRPGIMETGFTNAVAMVFLAMAVLLLIAAFSSCEEPVPEKVI